MARYLSRAELSCIAGKYIEMYYALFGISKNDPLLLTQSSLQILFLD